MSPSDMFPVASATDELENHDFSAATGVSVIVIVVAYHGDRWLPACLSSLRSSTRSGRVRLVLVDNGGNVCLDELPLDEFDHTVLRTRGQLGFAEANNFALQNFKFDTDAVCFLNQDTQSEGNWLDACLDCLVRSPVIGAVSPLVTSYDGSKWDPGFWTCARELPQLCATSVQPTGNAKWCPVIAATATCLVVRTRALLEAGPFDPMFGSYYEDYDLCRRIGDAGYNIAICPNGRVAHFGNSSTRTAVEQRSLARQVVRNRVIHQIRNGGKERIRATADYLLRTFPRNLCRSLIGTPSSQPLGAFLAAHCNLLLVSRRMLSEKRDLQAWYQYLTEIGWPHPRRATALETRENQQKTVA